MLRSRKAQAILELAVLGSLVIMAFAIVISTSENYNRQQSYMQQTFRATLYKAKYNNDTASVATVDFRRLSNVTNPMEIGSIQEYSSGNSVLWSDGRDPNTKSKQYFIDNRDTAGARVIAQDESGIMPGGPPTVSGSGYGTNLKSDNIYHKTESGNITTTKDLTATDSIVDGWATAGNQTVGTGGVLGTGGLYGRGGTLKRHTDNVNESE